MFSNSLLFVSALIRNWTVRFMYKCICGRKFYVIICVKSVKVCGLQIVLNSKFFIMLRSIEVYSFVNTRKYSWRCNLQSVSVLRKSQNINQYQTWWFLKMIYRGLSQMVQQNNNNYISRSDRMWFAEHRNSHFVNKYSTFCNLLKYDWVLYKTVLTVANQQIVNKNRETVIP